MITQFRPVAPLLLAATWIVLANPSPPRAAEGQRPPEDPLAVLGKSLSHMPPASPRQDRGYDALDLDLTLALDFNERRIIGRARHRFQATRMLDSFVLDFTDSLKVTGVWRGLYPAAFSHRARALTISLEPPVPQGAIDEVTILYRGHPPRDGLLGFAFQTRHGVPAAYTLSEPVSASAWWPCNDVPDDKLTATINLDIPDTLYAGSNGVLIRDESANGRRLMTWRESRAIAPYLVSIACTNYEVFGDLYTGRDGRLLPLLYLAYPEHREEAELSWARIPAMLRAFEDRFGPYPFQDEKYGMAEFSWGGAMENQTLTSYGEYLVDGTDVNDWVVAHELAHQWWGNKVTLADWEHMWLNEGFARYCEALYFESVGGIAAYTDWIRGMWRDEFPGRIVPPDYLFNSTVYLKGAWVLHMLRGVLGDEIFFAGLRGYGDRFAYGNASTEDLIATYEETAGRDLRWFFDPWVYETGRPVYDVLWSLDAGPAGPVLEVDVEQRQAGPPFKMPVEIEVQDPQGSYRFAVWDSLRSQTFRFDVRMPPERIRFDPDDWVLKDLHMVVGPSPAPEIVPAPAWSIGSPWPSPGAPPFHIPVGAAFRGRRIEILDATGRRISAFPVQAGSVTTWDGMDAAGRALPAGLYILRAPGAMAGGGRRILLTR